MRLFPFKWPINVSSQFSSNFVSSVFNLLIFKVYMTKSLDLILYGFWGLPSMLDKFSYYDIYTSFCVYFIDYSIYFLDNGNRDNFIFFKWILTKPIQLIKKRIIFLMM